MAIVENLKDAKWYNQKRLAYFQNILKEKWLVSSGLTKNISDRNDELLRYLLPTSSICHTHRTHAGIRAHVFAPVCARGFMCACAHACSHLHSPVSAHIHVCARMLHMHSHVPTLRFHQGMP